MSLRLSPFALFFLALGACGAGEKVDSVQALDIPAPPPASSVREEPAVARDAPTPRHAEPLTCGQPVIAGAVMMSSPTCFVDEDLGMAHGHIYRSCADGPATIVMIDRRKGEVTFEGKVENGRIEVYRTSQYPYSDGCDWTTTQSITGSVRETTLQYSYTEMGISRVSGGTCVTACSAAGPIKLSR